MQYRIGQFVGYVPVNDSGAAMSSERQPERWYVLKTFPNKERKVMATFARRGISAYFPTKRIEETREQRRFGRVVRRFKQTLVQPLFAGVIFIPDFQMRQGGVKVDGVEGYFRMGECYPYLTPSLYQEVRRIAGIANMPVSQKRRMMVKGRAVLVTDGPFAYFSGTFDSLDSEGRLKVLLQIFGRMTFVTLDEGQIEPV